MHPLFTLLDDHLKLILTVAAVLSLLVPKVRRIVRWVCSWIGKRLGGAKLDEILLLTRQNADKVAFIENELLFNGGSTLRDMVHITVSRQNQQFWRSLRPSIEMDGDAMVRMVSESLCNLIGVHDPQEFRDRNWLRFVQNGVVDDFLRSFSETAALGSSFSFDFQLRTFSGKQIGRWELRLVQVAKMHGGKAVYEGFFRPVDAVAIGSHDQQICSQCGVMGADCAGVLGARVSESPRSDCVK